MRGGPTPPLVILVGLTGVGKSTAVEALRTSVPGTALLPNRRELADRLVIPDALRLEGAEIRAVTDRVERFRLTARYRARNPGGLAHALARYLTDNPPSGPGLLLFDNLRGESEVRFALAAFPRARFIVLEAPADLRVLRLAGRRDTFDRVGGGLQASGERAEDARTERTLLRRLREVPDLAQLTDVAALAAAATGLDPEDVLTGARVVAEEGTYYDQAATWACLEPEPATRRMRVNTGREPAAEVAARIRAWL